MRKFIKIFLVSLGWVLAGVIFIPATVALLLMIPSVQTFAVTKASGLISRNLETTVSIRQLSVKRFGDVVVNGFYVEDYRGDTLLYADRISVSLSVLDIIRSSSSIAFGHARVEGCKLHLIQHEGEEEINISQIIDRIGGPPGDTPSGFRIDIAPVTLTGIQFILKTEERGLPAPEGSIDFSDIVLDRLNLECESLSVIGDSIVLKDITDFSFREKSGFDVERLLSSELTVSKGNIEMKELHLDTPESNMRFDYVRLNADGWRDYADFTNRVRIEGRASKSAVSTGTLGYFTPGVAKWDMVLRDAAFDFSGTVARIGGSIGSVRIGNSSFAAGFRISGLPDLNRARFDLNITGIDADAGDVGTIIEKITGEPLNTAKGYLSALGRFSATGHFDGSLDDFEAGAALRSEVGNLFVAAGLTPQESGAGLLNASVTADSLDLGRMLDIGELGSTSFEAKIDGTFIGKTLAFDTRARINSLEYNGYEYRDIRIDGEVKGRSFDGTVESRDPNLLVSFDGTADLAAPIPRYKAAIELNRADLHAIRLNRRDSVSVIRCSIDLDASGRRFDDLNGNITVNNLQYISPDDTVRSDRIILTGRNSAGSKLLSLSSPLIDAEFRSRASYRQTYDYVVNTLRFYLPTLARDDGERAVHDSVQQGSGAENYSMVNMDIKLDNAVAGIFVPGLHIAAGTNLRFVFNPDSDNISLTAKSEYIDLGNIFVADLDVTARNVGDSLTFYLNAREADYGSMSFPNLSVIGGARRNNLSAAARFSDPAADAGALINIAASLSENPQTNRPLINAVFNPSQFSSNGISWRISSGDILIDRAGVLIDNFRIYSDDQELTINGKASESAYDTLKLNLSNFRLSVMNRFIKDSPFSAEGTLTGYAGISSALKGGSLLSEVNCDGLTINGIEAPPLRFESRWDFANARARFSMAESTGGRRLITGYYSPSDRRIMADIDIREVDLALTNPLLEGILHSTSGSADISMQLTGSADRPVLNGNIAVRELVTTLDFTNAAYRVPLSEIAVENNIFTLRPTTLLDIEGNMASVDMRFDARNFRNLSYELNARPAKLIAMNTGASDNELFFGKVYATGSVSVRGGEAGVDIDIVATPEENSSFTMQMGGKSDLFAADFVNIIDRSASVEREPTASERRRQQYEKRNEKSGVRSEVNVNMAITATPSAEFRFVIDPTMGGEINGRGSGLVNLHINPTRSEFSMYGDYVISEGSYLFTLQNIINKRFGIDPGSSIKWTGDPANAILDIAATYSLRASLAPLSAGANRESLRRMVPVDCRVRLSEYLSQPAFTFDIEVPNADPETRNLVANAINTQEMMTTQVLFLLASGNFYSDASGLMQNIGTVGGASLAVDFLSSQLSNMLSNDRFDIGIRYRPMNELGSDEFGLDLSFDVFNERLRLEVEGNYDLQNNSSIRSGSSGLYGNFNMTYDLNRRGNLRARAFSRTIDRYDENMGLQENGVGIYFNDDFSTLGELLRRFGAMFGIRPRERGGADTESEDETGAAELPGMF